MTPYRHILHRKDESGEFKRVMELEFVDGWARPPAWLAKQQDGDEIDPDTRRYTVDWVDLLRLIRPAPLPWQADHYDEQHMRLHSLDQDGQYAVDWQIDASVVD